MDIEAYKEYIGYADMAFSSGQFDTAVTWYDKALGEAPNDEYALSKAGAALVSQSKFNEAFVYFQRAVDADPENGDDVFNLANAYFFSGDIPKAMECYTKAQTMKCSDDVAARIYYQLALMCSIKRDYSAALINYQKYEDADKTGQASLDTEIIAERVSLYIKLQDFDNALKYTVKWLALAPADIRCYMVYFNLLTATNDYEKAEKILDDAMKFAVKDARGKYAIDVSRANLYVSAAGTDYDKNGDFNQKAYDLMNELIVTDMPGVDKSELVLSLGELCITMNKVDEAIDLMTMLTEAPEAEPAQPAPEAREIDPAEIDAMMSADIQAMEAKIASGEISDDLGDNVPVDYDENGQPVRDYPDGIFGTDDEGNKLPDFKGVDIEGAVKEDAAAEAAAEAEFRARVNFIMLTCYALKEDYEQTLKYARIVKLTPNNSYYEFFGRYSEAFAMKQLAKQGKQFTSEEADRKYQEEIAFFRTKMLERNENSAYALIFRTRMYAETGKFVKAEELANLLPEQDRTALTDYIAECRKELGES